MGAVLENAFVERQVNKSKSAIFLESSDMVHVTNTMSHLVNCLLKLHNGPTLVNTFYPKVTVNDSK